MTSYRSGPAPTPQRGRGTVATLLAGLLLGLLILGGLFWNNSRRASDAPQQSMTAEAEERAASPAPSDPGERADAALREQRLFAPPGDNAFELYLEQRALRPDDPLPNHALVDLFPYAVLHVEQILAAGDAEDSERLLALMQRAQPEAPALPRLRRSLEQLRSTQSEPGSSTAATSAVAAAAPARAESVTTGETTAPLIQPAASTQLPPARTPAMAAAAPPGPVAQALQAPPAPVDRPTLRTVPVATAPLPLGLPEATYSATPRYPPLAMRRRIEGSVELAFTVGTDGSVSDIRVLESRPEGIFDREAVAAMQRWRFDPPTTPLQGRRSFDFRLADG